MIDASRLMAMRTAILEQNSALQRAAGVGFGSASGSTEGTPAAGGFGQALNSALSQVNEMQARSSAVTEAYERGETTDIASVMLARQQASIGFEATMQVRNKLLSAYRDIMNMPV
ncbi:MAG: flagellar hook-basal body complex protein FliE [Allosphingosinicella sp.]